MDSFGSNAKQFYRRNRITVVLLLITISLYAASHVLRKVPSSHINGDNEASVGPEWIRKKDDHRVQKAEPEVSKTESEENNHVDDQRDNLVNKAESEENNHHVGDERDDLVNKPESEVSETEVEENNHVDDERISHQDDLVNKAESEVTRNSTNISGQDLIDGLRSNSSTYGRIVGPFESTEDRILGTRPTGGCDKNGEFARAVRGRKFVVIMHELSMTGAPISMMELATELLICEATVSVVVLNKAGGLMGELERRKINVIEDTKIVSFKAAVEADVVIPGSAVCYTWIEQYRAYFPGSQSENIAWWIMENMKWYYEQSRHVLSRVKMLIFLLESQAKEWQAWCKEDNINLDSQEILVAPLSVNDELAFIAGISSTTSFGPEGMIDKRKELRKVVRKEMGLKDSDLVVMCLGSINQVKGQLLLLESVAQMMVEKGVSSNANTREGVTESAREQTTLKILIGSLWSVSTDWNYIQAMLRIIYEHPNLSKLVLWTPTTTRVAALYSAADIYVTNSQAWVGETFGRVTIEAMAFSLPVLGTDAGGTPYIVDNNKMGLLHPVERWGNQVLAQNLRFLLDNPLARQEMGARGREKVQKMYLKQHMLDKLAAGISKCLTTTEVPRNSTNISGEDLMDGLRSNSSTYGRIVGPFGTMEDRILGARPTGGCDKNGEFARVVRGRKFVVVMHVLSMTGAPISMMELATELLNCEAIVSVVVLDKQGGLMGELERRKINVIEDAKIVSFKAAVEADVVIPGSSVCSTWIEQYRAYFPGSQSENIAWWIMENMRWYYEHSRQVLSSVKMLIFLLESQAKVWQAWCTEDNINLEFQEIFVAPLAVNDELASIAGISSSSSFGPKVIIEKRKELRKAAREEMGLKDSDVVVMCLGSINHIKGQLLLLESVALMMVEKGGSSKANTREGVTDSEQEQTTFKILIGSLWSVSTDWDYFKAMLRLIYEHPNLSKVVLWTPTTTRVAALYSAADIYVTNSQAWVGETFGRVTVEAMAFSLPVLGTNAGGTPYIVDHNKTGLLHPVDPQGNPVLAQNLRFLLENPLARQEMGARGREKVEKMYLKQHMLDKLAAAISKFLTTT